MVAVKYTVLRDLMLYGLKWAGQSFLKILLPPSWRQ